jgi:hypothetical protein
MKKSGVSSANAKGKGDFRAQDYEKTGIPL